MRFSMRRSCAARACAATAASAASSLLSFWSMPELSRSFWSEPWPLSRRGSFAQLSSDSRKSLSCALETPSFFRRRHYLRQSFSSRCCGDHLRDQRDDFIAGVSARTPQHSIRRLAATTVEMSVSSLSLLVPCSHIPVHEHDLGARNSTARARFLLRAFLSLGSSSFTATIDCVAAPTPQIRTRYCRSPPAACPASVQSSATHALAGHLLRKSELPLFKPFVYDGETAARPLANFTCVFRRFRRRIRAH